MIHGKQFAILRNKLNIKNERYILLRDDWILSISKDVPYCYNEDKDILLIGNAWSIFPGESPKNSVLSGGDVLTKEAGWCGRYVLIINGEVYTDTSALYGVFYNGKGIASDIRFLHDGDERNWDTGDLGFFPGTDTPFGDVKRILPSQSYNYKTGRISYRPLIADVPKLDKKQRAERFSRVFCLSLRNMEKMFPNRRFLVALTGGYDSRALFSLMYKSGVPFECFTLEHSNMPPGDITTPKEICKRTGIKHTYIKREEGDPVSLDMRYAEYTEHVSGMVKEEDQNFYTYGQYEQLGDVILLRSNLWEIVVEYNERFIKDKLERNNVYDYYELKKNSLEYKSLEKALDWFDKHPENITDTNRVYWEIRGANWVAESEHGFDIYDDLISLQPMNCRYLISILLQYRKEERKNDFHQREIIKYCCPEISNIPFASNTDYLQTKKAKRKRLIQKTKRRIRKIGIARTIRLYAMLMRGRRKHG